MEEKIEFYIKIKPSNMEMELQAPIKATFKEILEFLIEDKYLARVNNENDPITYQFCNKSVGYINLNLTIQEAGIIPRMRVDVIPELVAG